MRSGRYNFSQTDASIGEDNETGGLALTRGLGTDATGHINPLANFSHNYDIFVSLKAVEMVTDGSGPGTRVRVHFGGRSETFEQRAGASGYVQASRTGYAILTVSGNIFTFTSNDGTVAIFRPFTGNGDCSTTEACAYVSTISYADGTRFTFDYDPPASPGTAHLRAVTSSRGYKLVLLYGSGADADYVASACVINLSIMAAPANHSCPASPLASASYGYTSLGGERRLASATDAGGATSTYAYSGLAGGFAMAFTRPGETGPWLTNANWPRANNEGNVDEIVTGQAFADGSTYTYAYDTSPQVEGEIPQIAGGHYVDPAGHNVIVRYDFPIKPGSTFGNVGGGAPGEPQTLFYQITPGPVEIVDALGRTSITDYCDRNAAANLPPSEHHRCLVVPVAQSFTSPEGIRTDLIWDLYTRLLGRTTQHSGRAPAFPTSSARRPTIACRRRWRAAPSRSLVRTRTATSPITATMPSTAAS